MVSWITQYLISSGHGSLHHVVHGKDAGRVVPTTHAHHRVLQGRPALYGRWEITLLWLDVGHKFPWDASVWAGGTYSCPQIRNTMMLDQQIWLLLGTTRVGVVGVIRTQLYLIKWKNGCAVSVWSRVSMIWEQGLLYNNKQRGWEKQRLIVKLLPQESF